MRDIMEIVCEAREKTRTPLENQNLFTELLFAELGKMKSADIAPHLSCVFDLLQREYRITLRFPAGFNEPDATKGDVE